MALTPIFQWLRIIFRTRLSYQLIALSLPFQKHMQNMHFLDGIKSSSFQQANILHRFSSAMTVNSIAVLSAKPYDACKIVFLFRLEPTSKRFILFSSEAYCEATSEP